MRRFLAISAIFATALTSVPANARDALRLQANSPWNLHYADDSCRLAKSFGEGEQTVTLILDQFRPGDYFKVTVAGEPLQPRSRMQPMESELRFGPDESEAEVTAMTGTIGDLPAIFINGDRRIAPPSDAEEETLEEAERQNRPFDLPPIGAEREAAVQWVAITAGLRSDIVLETGAMEKPLAALRKCAWDTVKLWGLDVEQQKTLSRKLYPKTDSSRWLDAGDYPSDMMRRGYQAIVNYRLIVDATGEPKSCHIQASTRPKEFDDAVCEEVMDQAEFEPALDAQGKPVPSYWIQTVRFRIQ